MKIKQRQHDIHVITTGGTIEKSYDELEGTLENRNSIVEELILSKLRLPYTRFKFHPIINKDSLQFTDDDRAVLSNKIMSLQADGWPILVIHGTDTMAQSAMYCESTIKSLSFPVIFTGAMRPLGFSDTDAHQNVTEAVYALKVCLPGVYLSFHGELFAASCVQKNYELRTFEELQRPETTSD